MLFGRRGASPVALILVRILVVVPTGALTASLLAHIVLAMALLTMRPARLLTDPPPVSIEVMAIAAGTPAVASEPVPATLAAPDTVAPPTPMTYDASTPAGDDT